MAHLKGVVSVIVGLGKTPFGMAKPFIRTEEHTSGSCKGFAGGAWGGLPIFVSEIKVK